MELSNQVHLSCHHDTFSLCLLLSPQSYAGVVGSFNLFQDFQNYPIAGESQEQPQGPVSCRYYCIQSHECVLLFNPDLGAGIADPKSCRVLIFHVVFTRCWCSNLVFNILAQSGASLFGIIVNDVPYSLNENWLITLL